MHLSFHQVESQTSSDHRMSFGPSKSTLFYHNSEFNLILEPKKRSQTKTSLTVTGQKEETPFWTFSSHRHPSAVLQKTGILGGTFHAQHLRQMRRDQFKGHLRETTCGGGWVACNKGAEIGGWFSRLAIYLKHQIVKDG